MPALAVATGVSAVLESMNSVAPPTFQTLLEQLYLLRYKGPVTLHFVDGVPGVVEFSQPVQVKLHKGA